MDESTKTTPNTEVTKADESKSPAFAPPATQEALDKMINAAVGRTHAKYEGFDDYKKKAEAFDKQQEESMSELEKLTARLEKAEGEAKALKSKQQIADWIVEVAEAKGVPANALRGSSKEEIEAHADSLKPLLAESGVAPVVEGDGKQPQAPSGSTGDFIRDALNR